MRVPKFIPLSVMLSLVWLLSGCAGVPVPPAPDNPDAPAEPEAVIVDYRGPLPPGAEARLGRGAATAVAYSADGELLAVGSAVGVQVMQAEDFSPVWSVPSAAPALSIGFSLQGDLLAAGLESGTLALFNAQTGELLTALEVEQPVTAAAWGASDVEGAQRLAFGFNNGEAILIDLAGEVDDLSAEGSAALPRLRGGLTALAFNPESSLLALGSSVGTVTLWDADAGEAVAELEGHRRGSRVDALAWSADGALLLSGGADGQVLAWNASQAEQEAAFDLGAPVKAVGFSADGEGFSALDETGQLTQWEGLSGEGQALPMLSGDADVVYAAFGPGTEQLAAAAEDGRLLATALAADQVTVLEGYAPRGQEVLALAWSAEGVMAAAAGRQVNLWTTPYEAPQSSFEAGQSVVTALAWSPDEALLAAGQRDGALSLWNLRSGTRLRLLQGHEDQVAALSWHPDGSRLFSAGSLDGQVILWDLDAEAAVYSFIAGEQGVFSLALSPAGDVLATGLNDGRILLWDVTDDQLPPNQPLEVLRGHLAPVNDLAWSPDGERLASAASDRRVVVWDMATYEEMGFSAHDGPVRAAAWSPDGEWLASAGQEGLINLHLVELMQGPPVEVLAGHTDDATAVSWSPDGALVASASTDGTLILWAVDSRQ